MFLQAIDSADYALGKAQVIFCFGFQAPVTFFKCSADLFSWLQSVHDSLKVSHVRDQESKWAAAVVLCHTCSLSVNIQWDVLC